MRVRSVNKSRRLQGGANKKGSWSTLGVAGAGVAGVSLFAKQQIRDRNIIRNLNQILSELREQYKASTDDSQKERLRKKAEQIEKYLNSHKNLVNTITNRFNTEPTLITEQQAQFLNLTEQRENDELF